MAISTRRNVNSSDSQTLTYTLDADDHVTRLDSSTSTATYQLGSGGRIEREDLAAIDIDSGPYTRVTEHTFDAEGRPSTRRIDDSRGPSGSFGWQYEVSPGRLVVEVTREATTHSRYIYSYDASDRPIKAENDSDGDGTTDWSVEIAYADDGAVTTRMFPRDAASSVHTFSSGCNYAIEAPQLPRARSRPGPEWQFLIPSMPDAYE